MEAENRDAEEVVEPPIAARTFSITSEQVHDKYNFVYVSFCVLAVASILPWNLAGNMSPFYQYKVRDPDINGTAAPVNELQGNIVAYNAIVNMISNLVIRLIGLWVSKAISLDWRMHISFSMLTIPMVVFTVFVWINTERAHGLFLAVTLICGFILSGGRAMLGGYLFGLCTMFPQQFSRVVVNWQGAGGVITVIVNLIVILTISENVQLAAFINFMLGALVVIGAQVLYVFMRRTEFAQYHCAAVERAQRRAAERRERQDSVLQSRTMNLRVLRRVLRLIAPLGITFFFQSTTTLMAFPGLLTIINSVDPPPAGLTQAGLEQYRIRYVILTVFLVYNIGSFVGRYLIVLAPKLKIDDIGSRKRKAVYTFLIAVSVARILFTPLFMLCNVVKEHRNFNTVVFNSDAWPVIFMGLFSLSDGFLIAASINYLPVTVPKELSDTAGFMITIFSALGLLVGSLLNIAVLAIV